MKVCPQLRLLLCVSFVLYLIGCGSTEEKQTTSAAPSPAKTDDIAQKAEVGDTVIERNSYRLVSINNNLKLQNYHLELVSELTEPLESGIHSLQFKITDPSGNPIEKNKDLKVGLLLNNEFQEAKSIDALSFELDFLPGNNVILAYLIDAHGISVKSPNAAVLKNYYVGKGKSSFDKNAAQLFYIKPLQGSLTKKEKFLHLDFFLFNASLMQGDYKIKLRIDEEVFFIDRWQSFQIENLKTGEHRIRMQLINKSGKTAPGPFNDSGLRHIAI